MPFWHFEKDGLMVYEDGSLGCGFELKGIDIGTQTNEFINDISVKLENFLTSAPQGFRLQFFYRPTSSIEGVLREHEAISQDAPDKYRPIVESRTDFLRSIQDSNGFFTPKITFFIRGKPHGFSKRKLWQSVKKFECITREEFDEHREEFFREKEQIVSSLKNAGLTSRELTSREWFKLLFSYFNLSRSEKLKLPKPTSDPFNFQCILEDVHLHKSHLEMGDYKFKGITLQNLPEGESFASMIDGLLEGIPFHFALSLTIETLDQKTETDKLQLQRRLAASMAKGAKNVSDLESESKLRHTEELISELIEGGKKVVAMGLTIVLWAKTTKELEEKSGRVLQEMQNMGGAEGLKETLPLLDAFINAGPGICEVFRSKKVKTSNCAHFLPVYAPWKGNDSPICLFENRSGGVVKIDPFSSKLPNKNALMFASSGSGKSFAVLQLAMQFYGQHPTPRIVWIDNGASSERLLDSSILDGQFIDLNLDSGICLNMFDLSKGESHPSPSKIKLILAILEQILREDGDRGLPKRHRALIEESIYRAYQGNEGIPVLSDLKKILDNHDAKDMQEYGRILYPWTENRAYGRMLDGKTNIDLTKNLITVEIKGLDTYPDLQNVMLLNFTEFIKTQAARDTTRPTLLIVDEAWKLLETPSGLAFVVEAYRTFRKYGAGIWCISQNYKDFLKDETVANALFPNTASVFILKQNKIDWVDFGQRLQLNESEVEAVKSLHSVKGESSEVFFIQDENKAILRISPDPLAYYIATSDPEDKELIKKMEKKHPNENKLQILQRITEEEKNANTKQ